MSDDLCTTCADHTNNGKVQLKLEKLHPSGYTTSLVNNRYPPRKININVHNVHRCTRQENTNQVDTSNIRGGTKFTSDTDVNDCINGIVEKC